MKKMKPPMGKPGKKKKGMPMEFQMNKKKAAGMTESAPPKGEPPAMIAKKPMKKKKAMHPMPKAQSKKKKA